VVASSFAQIPHLELEGVEGIVKRLAELVALAGHYDLATAGVAGNADLVPSTAMVLGRLADDADIEEIPVPLSRERLDALLDFRPLLAVQPIRAAPVNLHRSSSIQ
jgi:hypothetical protein